MSRVLQIIDTFKIAVAILYLVIKHGGHMDDPKNYLFALVEEYKSLRDESKQASINMFAAFQWGAAVLGVIIAAAFTQWGKQDAVVLLTFYLIVPILSAMTLFLWLGEATRFRRVGDYICLLEQKAGIILNDFKQHNNVENIWSANVTKIEDSLKMPHSELDLSDPLVWEQWLRDMKDKSPTTGHIEWIYKIRFGFFILLMVVSFMIATYYASIHPRFLLIPVRKAVKDLMPDTNTKLIILLVMSLIFILVVFVIAYRFAKKLTSDTETFRRNIEAK